MTKKENFNRNIKILAIFSLDNMTDSAYQPTRRELLGIVGLTGLLAAPTLATAQQQATYDVKFEIRNESGEQPLGLFRGLESRVMHNKENYALTSPSKK